MAFCTNCGTQNTDEARFCASCGSPLGHAAPATAKVRKTVTVVFTDITGSTSLGESLDPESLQSVISRYFAEMSTVLQKHGGTIEKFIGDAIVAVFGVPVVHEDDALRAVRAAFEMRSALDEMNRKLEDRWGVRIQVRTGVNTGEVLTGGTDPSQGQALATGDTMNVAARLEQAADPGSILIGEDTYRLVRDAVEVEPLEPLTLKGKADPVPAFRLENVVAGAPGTSRRLDSPLVGREEELALLRAALDRAVSGPTCSLVTIYGPAGIGKTRLASEFIRRAEDAGAQVITGRCLSYGEGITFWPMAEAVKLVCGISDTEGLAETEAKITALLPDDDERDLVVDRLLQMLNLRPGAAAAQEIFSAVRRFIEALARERPVVVLLDDIHWAESTFLDLIGYLAGWLQGVPVVLLCMARRELLDQRPDWGSSTPDAIAIHPKPLNERDSDRLIENLLGGSDLPEQVRRTIARSSEGHPLYVEEILRMLIDDGAIERTNGKWAVVADLSGLKPPPTVQALLAARLDRLKHEERVVVQRASIVGKTFWWGAVTELSPPPERTTVGGHLQTLVRKELVFPERSNFPGEDAFRFGHIMVRDAAYEGLTKQERAELHHRFAGWLEAKAGQHVDEYEEILGYHLEQATRLRREVSPLDDEADAIAERAVARLGSAGRRALARSDVSAAGNLLQRAVDLLPPRSRERLIYSLELFDALLESGEIDRAQELADEVTSAATELNDPTLAARAVILRRGAELHEELPDGWLDRVQPEIERAIQQFEAAGDHLSLTHAYQLLADIHWNESDYLDAERDMTRALEHARAAGSERDVAKVMGWLPAVLYWGPMPAGVAISRCDEILAMAGDQKVIRAKTLVSLGGLEAMVGEYDAGRGHVAAGLALLEELGMSMAVAAATQLSGSVELMAGDALAAERELRRGYERLQEMGERRFQVTAAAMLADALYAQERFDQAEEMTRVAEELGEDDPVAKGDWAGTRAKILAARGDAEEAVALAKEAVAVFEHTDETLARADTLLDLAYVLSATGDHEAAMDAARGALELYAEKGIVSGSAEAKAFLS